MHIVLKHHIVIIEYEGHSYVITYARTRLALPIKFPHEISSPTDGGGTIRIKDLFWTGGNTYIETFYNKTRLIVVFDSSLVPLFKL